MNAPVNSKRGIKRIWQAIFYSLDGLGAAFEHEDAFRLEVVLALALIPLALSVHVDAVAKALLIASVYAALSVRRADDTVAMIVPPLAFVVAALTAGQINIGAVEGSLFNRAAVVFFTLAENWVWIIVATLAAAVIVLVRRKRG